MQREAEGKRRNLLRAISILYLGSNYLHTYIHTVTKSKDIFGFLQPI